MRIALVLAALALVGVPSAGAGSHEKRTEGKNEAKNESKEAKRLFDAAPVTTVRTRPASVEEVARVAAEVEGIELPEAIARVSGAAPGADAAATSVATAAAAVYCSWVEWQNGRGTFPYRRWIVGQTYWCYEYGGAITYRASNTVARVDGVCSGSNPRDWRVSGGAGYSWVVVHHEADFSCRTPWWYPLNDSIWMEPAFNSYGSTSMTRQS